MTEFKHIANTLDKVSQLCNFSKEELLMNHIDFILDEKPMLRDLMLHTPNKFHNHISNDPENVGMAYIILLPDIPGCAYNDSVINTYSELINRGCSLRFPQLIQRSQMSEVLWGRLPTNSAYKIAVSESGECSLVEYGKRSKSGFIQSLQGITAYQIIDDYELSFLKALSSRNLTSNVMYVQQPLYKKDILKTELFNVYGVDGAVFDTTEPRKMAITKVMTALLESYNINPHAWSDKKNKVLGDNYIRINFNLGKNNRDVSKFMVDEFLRNDIVPLRFSWSTGYDNKHIIGGSVLCPLDSHVKFVNKLKLYNVSRCRKLIDKDDFRREIIRKTYGTIES